MSKTGKEKAGDPKPRNHFTALTSCAPAKIEKTFVWLLILLLPLMVFLPVVGHDFLGFDDGINIAENPNITEFSLDNLLYFWQGPYLKLYIPLTYNLWGLLAGLAGFFPTGVEELPNPIFFHTANLLLHLGNAVLVFRILKILLRDDWAAALGTLFFAIHPVQVEAVAWATGLKDVFSGFWSLLALWQYVIFCQAGEEGGGRFRNYLWSGIFLLGAMLAKPSAVVVPMVAGVIGYLFFAKPPRCLLRELAPGFMAAIPVLLVTQYAQPGAVQNFTPVVWQRLLIAGDTLTFYSYKLLFPLSLGPDYGQTPYVVLQRPLTYLTGVLPYLLGALLFWKGQRLPKAAGGIFLAALLPVLGLVPFEFQKYSTVADRYLYPAMLGLALGMGWLALRYRSQPKIIICFWVMLLLCAGRSMTQVRYWQNENLFYQNALAVNPASWFAANNLGTVLESQGDLPAAARLLEQAIANKPDYDVAYNNLGVVRHRQGQLSEAKDLFKQALALNPNYAEAAANLGNHYFVLGKIGPAREYYLQALNNNPEMSAVYTILGDIAFTQGRLQKAIERYNQARDRGIESAEIYNNLGMIRFELGNYHRAVARFERADFLSPNQPAILFNLGRAHLALGEIAAARQAFLKVLAVDQEFAPALAGLANLYRLDGREDLALDYAAQASALGFTEEADSQILGKLPLVQNEMAILSVSS